jgi:DNA-binding MarR family transcriptional regulator
MSSKHLAPPTDLSRLPGHQIRRLHQIAVAIFLQDTERHGLTPVQFAALQAIQASPMIDQRTLASKIGLDTSTMGGVIDRLEARRQLARHKSPGDRRVNLVSLTAEGQATLAAVQPAMLQAQARILAPLSAEQQAQFMGLLNMLVEGNNELSRAPVPPSE